MTSTSRWVGTMRLMIVSCIAILLLGGCSGADERKAAHLTKATALYESRDFEKARLEYKNVLKIEPTHTQARFMLARTLEELDEFAEAARHYQQVVSAQPDHFESRLFLGQLYVRSGETTAAAVLAEECLVLRPDDTDALTLQAAVKVQIGEIEVAEQVLRHALSSAPSHAEALTLLASLKFQQGRIAEAIEMLKEGIRQNVRNTDLRTLLATILASQNQVQEAAEVLQEVLALEPYAFERRIQVARYLQSVGNVVEAQAVLRAGIEIQPDEMSLKLALIESLGRTGDTAKALETLENFLTADPDQTALQFGLGDLYGQLGMVVEEESLYQRMIEEKGTTADGLLARNRLAFSLARRGELDAARDLLDEILKENALDKAALLLLATLELEAERPDSAIIYLRTILRDHPNDAQVLRMLGQAHLVNSESNQAKQFFARASKLAPAGEATHLLVRVLLEEGDAQSAKQLLRDALAAAPGDRQALETLARLHLQERNWPSAVELANHIVAAEPEWFFGYYISGVAHQATGEHDSALVSLKTAREKNDRSLEVLTALLRSFVALERAGEALDHMSAELAKNEPPSAAALNLQGELLASLGRYDEAVHAFEGAIHHKREWGIPYRNLAKTHLEMNREEAAVETYRRGIQATAGAPSLVFDLAQRYESLGHHELAIAQYEDLLARQPDLLPAANNLAMLLLTHRDDTASVNRASELAQRFVDARNPDYLDTLAWSYSRSGDYTKAISILETLVADAPQAAEYRYHLGAAYHGAGDKSRAAQELRAAIEMGTPPFRGLQRAKQLLKTLE